MPARRRSTPRSSCGSSTASKATARRACGWTSRPGAPAKLLRKGGKHAAWGLFSLATGFTFVGYFVPIHDLARTGIALAWTPWEWFWIVFYGLATYGNAGFLREQMCKYMCPYARFQSALIDADSLIITYDQRRGEPRGGRARTADPKALGLGDCVDCSLCVQVCPTGIDIRKGLQNECIGCAACIDACDGVMDRLGYARGLIRYDTENGVAQGLNRGQMLRRVFRPRVLVYGALLTALVVVFGATLGLRSGLKVDVIKDRNTLARIVDDGHVENVYRLHIFNGSEQPRRVRLQVTGIDGLTFGTPQDVQVPATGMEAVPVRLRLSPGAAQALRGRSNPIVFQIRDAASPDGASVNEKSAFFVPR
jgi:cytochrome c oxidase accessory protein FixG